MSVSVRVSPAEWLSVPQKLWHGQQINNGGRKVSVVPGKRFHTNWINTFLEEIGKRRAEVEIVVSGGRKVPSIPKLQFPW